LSYKRHRNGLFEVETGGAKHPVQVYGSGTGIVDFSVDNLRLSYRAELHGDRWFLHGSAGDIELIETPRFPDAESHEAGGGLMAPMPGVIRSLTVSPGQAVEKGQVLLVLEAMKMEHRILAPHDGVVAEVTVAQGEQVKNGQKLLTLES
jgi:propionyl-CoA carboxylase alpha chain